MHLLYQLVHAVRQLIIISEFYKMEKLIPLINQIQEVIARTNLPNIIELPQIVVIGA